jgi:hypothetical protein
VRHVLTWVLTAPLLVIGLLAGHSLGYRWALADAHERAHVLDATGHGYLGYAPLIVAVAGSLVVAAFAARVHAAVGSRRTSGPAPWLAAVLPPPAFLVQEYAERALHSEVAWTTALEPAVLAGLLVQIPIALTVLALARALSRLAEVVARAIGAELRSRVADVLSHPSLGGEPLAPARIAGRGWSERGPPPHHRC